MSKKSQKEIKPTPRQWTFASSYVRYQSILKAFDAAYPKHLEKPMYRKRAMSKRIFAQKGTQMAIQELTQDVRRAEKMTVEGHLSELKRIRDAAFAGGQFATARQAEVDRGKCAGFYIERSMNVNLTTNPDQIRSQLEALLQQYPQMTQVLGLEGQKPLRLPEQRQDIEVVSVQSCSPQETSTDTDTEADLSSSEPTD